MHALAESISDRTRAIVLVNPNNPTGSYVKKEELRALLELGLPLISDEVFSDYGFGEDRDRVTTLAGVEDRLCFSMSGLSKIAGLPQMKLGWIVVSGPPELRREAMEKLEWIADTYLSVGHAGAMRGGEAARSGADGAAGDPRAARLPTWRRPARALAGSAADILAVEGGWYIVIKMPRIRSEEEWVLELLSSENLLVQPGFFYDFESEAFLIVSLLTEPAMFREGIGRLAASL